MSEHIVLSTSQRVQTMTIARIEKKNAITQKMYQAMADAIIAYDADDNLRAMVITGQGDYFTAGNDLMDFASAQARQSDELPGVMQFLFAISQCEKPLLAAVNGPGIGIGLTMLLHCDLVIAAKSATLSAPFVRLAVVPEAASSQLLAKHTGMAIANDILLAGRTLSAQEAVTHGLVARVVEDDALVESVNQLALHIADSSPTSLKRSKALIRHDREEIRALILEEVKIFAEQLKSDDFKESAMALMQKRKPVYK